MFPFSLYAIAGVLAGVHLYLLLVFTVYTPAAALLEWAALLGSLCLLVAACVSLFKPRVAAQIALNACLLIWAFYAPATVRTVQTKLLRHSVPMEHSVPGKR